jgi:hypothetical protein
MKTDGVLDFHTHQKETFEMIANNNEKPGWGFYPAWIFLNAVAVFIATGIAWSAVAQAANIVGDTIVVNGQRRITEDFLLFYIWFPVIGLTTGLAQYALLRHLIPNLRWWVAATVLGWLLPFLAGFILTPIFNSSQDIVIMWSLIGMPMIGVVIGLPQWLVLRRKVHRAYLWILAHALGWWAFGILNLFSSEPNAVITAIALIPAFATGFACWLLLDRLPNRAEPSSS